MPLYTYKAADSKGKLIKGELEAASEMEATTQLAKMGCLPISISVKAEGASGKGKKNQDLQCPGPDYLYPPVCHHH